MSSAPSDEPGPTREAVPPAFPGRFERLAASALVLIPIAAVYAQVRSFAFVNYDDQHYVTDNPVVLRGLGWDGVAWAFGGVHVSNWHPLAWLSHMADVSLFGADAGAHHVMSLAFHALNALLLFAFLLRATGAVWRSAFVAILFGVHPLHVESVAWISERKDVLSGFFFFVTLHAWLSYAQRPSATRYAAVAGSLALGLLAKPMLVTVPFVLLLVDVWPLGRLGDDGAGVPSRLAALCREKLPLFAIAAASAAATWLAQRDGGSVMEVAVVPFGGRVANAVVSYAVYLLRAAWPSGLAVFYPHPVILHGAIPIWKTAAATLLVVALTAAAFRERVRRPYLQVGWLWFLGMLVPVIGIAQVGAQALADRYTYLPLVGVIVAASWGGAELLERFRVPRSVTWASAGLVVLALSFAGHRQVMTWRDSLSLNSRAVAVTERNWVAWNGLGDALADSGRFREAIDAYERAIGIQPGLPEPWNGLGTVYGSLGAHSKAMVHFEQALKLRPRLAVAWHNLGIARVMAGDPRGARECLAMLALLDPVRARALRELVESGAR